MQKMFEIFGFNFHWYGLLIGLAVWSAIEIALINRKKIRRELIEASMWWAIFGGVVGARVYHVIDYWNRYYSSNILKVFYFWEGGLGIWGAIVGGFIALTIFCHFNKLKLIEYMDALVVGVPLAQAIGRVGNYINGELYGKKGEPIFAYEGVLNFLLFLILWNISKKSERSGFISGIYLIGYGIIRSSLENFRPTASIWVVFGLPMATIFSFFSILCGVFLIFRKTQS